MESQRKRFTISEAAKLTGLNLESFEDLNIIDNKTTLGGRNSGFIIKDKYNKKWIIKQNQ